MRYSREHKQETHARIVRKASVRLREKGAHGIGVADLMKEAGLTHGGFYAHFGSKEALVEAACRHGVGATIETLDFRARQAPPGEGLRTIANTAPKPPKKKRNTHRKKWSRRGCIGLPS